MSKKLVNLILNRAGYQISRKQAQNHAASTNSHISNDVIYEYSLVSNTPGFLDQEAYNFFCTLADIFPLNKKDLLEIGVFCGRSLIGLALAFKQSSSVVGVDPFYANFDDSSAYEDETELLSRAANYSSREIRLEMLHGKIEEIRAYNSDIAERIILEETTQEEFVVRSSSKAYHLVHIDGEHTYTAVKHFLDHASKILARDSWIIVDDFLNPGFPGISEAMHVHDEYKNSIFPVCYGFNKALFAYRPSDPARVAKAQNEIVAAYSNDRYLLRTQEDGSTMIEPREAR